MQCDPDADQNSFENKNFYLYQNCFNSKNIKEVKKSNEKIGVTHPGLKEVLKNKERIGATHPGPDKRGKSKRTKKVGLPTPDNSKAVENMAVLVMTLLTGSAILSSLPADPGNV